MLVRQLLKQTAFLRTTCQFPFVNGRWVYTVIASRLSNLLVSLTRAQQQTRAVRVLADGTGDMPGLQQTRAVADGTVDLPPRLPGAVADERGL